MKITSASSPILEAITKASLALPPRTTMPVLTLARIDYSPDGIEICCDSLDCAISVRVPEVKADSRGQFFVSPRLLKASLRGEGVTMTLNGTRLRIESGGTSTIETAMSDVAPKLREPMDAHPVDGKALNFALKSAINCLASGDDSLAGCVAWDKELQAMIGSDSKAFSLAPVQLGCRSSILIPRFCANLICQCFDWDSDLAMGTNGKALYFVSGNVRAWCSLAEAKIPRYAPMVSEPPKVCKVPREAFLKALNELLAFAEESFPRLRVRTAGNAIVLSTGHNGNESRCEIECEPNAEVSLCTMLTAVTRSIRYWTSDEIGIYKGDRFMLRPEDQSGALALPCLMREDV